MIYRRYTDTASDAVRRWYFRMQAERLFRYERDVCRRVRHVVAGQAGWGGSLGTPPEEVSAWCGGQGVTVFFGMAKPVRSPQIGPAGKP